MNITVYTVLNMLFLYRMHTTYCTYTYLDVCPDPPLVLGSDSMRLRPTQRGKGKGTNKSDCM